MPVRQKAVRKEEVPLSDKENAYQELQERELYILTEFFKLLGDPTRIHILFLLMERDACVSDLADRLGLTQSAVSHQLSLLKANKLVRRRRDGKMIFYTLVDDHVRMVIEKGTEHVLLR
ncbi:MAG: metalloregulator ArsR/SmtB family transcription factor [Oscillospiraceae bacterium]|nr:metalloregulator ArsR/SmtB family transcription factor [Oscillospiraceae bacterium]